MPRFLTSVSLVPQFLTRRFPDVAMLPVLSTDLRALWLRLRRVRNNPGCGLAV
jgi:hypothetical protein